MDAFVTVANFVWPTEAVVPRGLLEDAGIEVQLKDELTVQVHNLVSQAVGGVKLQVAAADAERARELLREGGFLTEGRAEDPAFWIEVDRITGAIPLLGRIKLLMARVLVLITIVLLIVVVPIAISAQPGALELLTAQNWCVDRVQVNGKEITAASTSTGLYMVRLNGCSEELYFDREGTVHLPGFDTPSQYVNWTLDNGGLHFEGLQAHHDVYGGPFSVIVNERQLTLRSLHTTIYCSRTW